MAIQVNYDYYSQWAQDTVAGRDLLDYPDSIVDALDAFLDGRSFDSDSDYTPDNVLASRLDVTPPADFFPGENENWEDMDEEAMREYWESYQPDATLLGYVGGQLYVLY